MTQTFPWNIITPLCFLSLVQRIPSRRDCRIVKAVKRWRRIRECSSVRLMYSTSSPAKSPYSYPTSKIQTVSSLLLLLLSSSLRLRLLFLPFTRSHMFIARSIRSSCSFLDFFVRWELYSVLNRMPATMIPMNTPTAMMSMRIAPDSAI